MAAYAPLYIPSAQTSITVLDDNATLHDQSVQTVVEGKEAIDPFLVTIGPDDPADPKVCIDVDSSFWNKLECIV